MPPLPKRAPKLSDMIPIKRIGPIDAPIVPPSDDVVGARKATWAGWLNECDQVHASIVEAMVAQLPNG